MLYEKRGKRKEKIMTEMAATNVVAGCPPHGAPTTMQLLVPKISEESFGFEYL